MDTAKEQKYQDQADPKALGHISWFSFSQTVREAEKETCENSF